MDALFRLGDHSICSMATFAPLWVNSAGLSTSILSTDMLAPTPTPMGAGSKNRLVQNAVWGGCYEGLFVDVTFFGIEVARYRYPGLTVVVYDVLAAWKRAVVGNLPLVSRRGGVIGIFLCHSEQVSVWTLYPPCAVVRIAFFYILPYFYATRAHSRSDLSFVSGFHIPAYFIKSAVPKFYYQALFEIWNVLIFVSKASFASIMSSMSARDMEGALDADAPTAPDDCGDSAVK